MNTRRLSRRHCLPALQGRPRGQCWTRARRRRVRAHAAHSWFARAERSAVDTIPSMTARVACSGDLPASRSFQVVGQPASLAL
eukprot:2680264-Pyramimonas_sp.AAC.1